MVFVTCSQAQCNQLRQLFNSDPFLDNIYMHLCPDFTGSFLLNNTFGT